MTLFKDENIHKTL